MPIAYRKTRNCGMMTGLDGVKYLTLQSETMHSSGLSIDNKHSLVIVAAGDVFTCQMA